MSYFEDPLTDERAAALDARLNTLPADDDGPSWFEAEADRLADEAEVEAELARNRRRVNGWTMRTGA